MCIKQGTGIKYYCIRNDNFKFSVSLFQTQYAIPNLLNQICSFETKPNLPNQIYKIESTKHKLGLSWGSTRLRQLAWSSPTKLNIVFITVFNIGLNIELHIRLNIGFNIGFNIGVQYWVWYWGSILGSIFGFNIRLNIAFKIGLSIGVNSGFNIVLKTPAKRPWCRHGKSLYVSADRMC